jgi:hypothetical protein
MRPLVLAPCTRRKRAEISPTLRGSSLPIGEIRFVAETWVSRVRASEPVIEAGNFYGGRSLVEAKSAAEAVKAELYFVSAGLGIISQNDKIPAYSLTTSPGDVDTVSEKITDNFNVQIWWMHLNRSFGFTKGRLANILSNSNSVALLALPSTYLMLIAHELSSLPAAILARVRLIGPPKHKVPPNLAPFWMPYDARLDTLDPSRSGTRSDFPQRAARHFAEVVLNDEPYADAAKHASLVTNILTPFRSKTTESGRSATDAELIKIIRDLLPGLNYRSTVTLRHLRRELRIACEQSRFRKLFEIARRGDCKP